MKKSLALVGISALLLASPVFAEDGDHSKHFNKVDTNADGFVSKDEFMKRADDRFSKTDADKDGKLSKDERKAAWEHMKAKRDEWKAKRAAGGGTETPAAK